MQGEFSYAGDLWNYSLLADSWTPLGLSSTNYQPAARSGHTAVWDSSSRSLLVHAGFDASYKGDFWRYLGTEVPQALVVECVLGQACSVEYQGALPAGTAFMVSDSDDCSTDKFLDQIFLVSESSQLDFVSDMSQMAHGDVSNASYINIEPGRGPRHEQLGSVRLSADHKAKNKLSSPHGRCLCGGPSSHVLASC